MKITQKYLRKIIREEAEPGPERADATSASLKNWFVEKAKGINDLGVPTQQIPSLIATLDDLIAAAATGNLKSKEDYLHGQISKSARLDQAPKKESIRRISKRHLRKIIKEEMNEYGSRAAGTRAIGSYFDVSKQATVEAALDDLYENVEGTGAWTAAMDDMGDVLDAENMVADGLRTMLEEWIRKNITGGH